MSENDRQSKSESSIVLLPVLPLRDMVVYPHMVVPLFIGRKKSVQALERAMVEKQEILLTVQRDAAENDPSTQEIHQVGTVATILQLLKLPDGTVKVLVEGGYRARIERFIDVDNYFLAEIGTYEEHSGEPGEFEELIRSTVAQFEKYVKFNKKIPSEIISSLAGINTPGHLADVIAAHLLIKIDKKQELLEIKDTKARLERLAHYLEQEIDLLRVERKVQGRVKKQMEKNQREYYLNEQMKAIQKELGDTEHGTNDMDELEKRIARAGMSKEAKTKAITELGKLKMMPPMSSEATMIRNYVEWLLDVPWKKRTKIRHDILKAEEILEEDHYGLEKVKERILEYLAVQQRVKKLKGPILCLVGPPGVGKTSLGKSMARATGREFIRMSLGGVRDEAEIRGHRRTYIGALPGRIIQKLAKGSVRNPLFLLDEVDKMSMDFRGDPSSALLEVLDPEQNHAFNDHYLEVDYDLSEIMFVATANSTNIPPPLLDRMEVIRIPGYTESEKINIAKRYLVPKQMKGNGLEEKELDITESAIQDIIRFYTREAGVRNIEREIAKISRKVVKQKAITPSEEQTIIIPKTLQEYLGVQRFRYGRAEEEDRVGHVAGLAWTETGGDLMTIEAAIMPGKGNLTHTGSLGDVMQESVQAAMTVVRARTVQLGLEPKFYQKHDIHIHVPEGATPKDGPSAGVGMCTALVSTLTKIPVRSNVAMTGEITLRGEVLPIGGLKEKLLAALRGGITTVLIPQENQRDLSEIPDNIKEGMDIRTVKWIDQVLEIALQRMPIPSTAVLTETKSDDEKGIIPTAGPGRGAEREPLHTTH
uniref:Lon protease n=1 Tax=Candidatus Kentrum sp. MB TaxID=2138164 RepID=A0A450XXZ4_9GAMM|nr:MAG: ATP-dependent proteinase. Serine peptidase. MEROPS family S16 [Candidatus Kentron sp. MB]VFK34171.1 MAG: ATP-dependent proteinase. Serine peptidase. MEROPS family S16 [Candidatus Kentron sp. MB]VFK76727.1 MAG: ATP-dependent proteinase. Serine peptidase. MEROPS family S16 [Candidatus Kentron sp. MB]